MFFMRKRSEMKRKEILTGYLMISPLLIGLGVFFVYSFFVNIYYSMTNKKNVRGDSLYRIPEFRKAIRFGKILERAFEYL